MSDVQTTISPVDGRVYVERPYPSAADIDKALEAYGRSAIPVNVLLIPGKDPIILPELLGPKDVLEALGQIED